MKGEAKQAIEALKADHGLSNNSHFSIMGNGDYYGPGDELFGNILDYLP